VEPIEAIEQFEPLEPGEPVAAQATVGLRETAALARLGAEGLLRLRARHAELLTRISEKVQDEGRRDELKTQADRLNPDTWVTDSEVTAGLEQYETVFESVRSVVGRRRKRRRRRSGAAAANGTAPGTQGTEESDEPGDDEGEPGQTS
jgi:hypothetical protein